MSTTTTQDTALQTYTIDPAHSQAGFTVRHMGFSKVRGSFETFEGTVRMEPENIESLEAEVSIDTASITTRDEKRDAHLRSEDFFHADKHPTLDFRSTGVKNVSGNSFTLEGELSMRGKTRDVALEAEYLGEGQDPWGGTRVAFEAATTINRKDFGLNWNQALEAGGVLVSEKVDITLEVQAVRDDA